MEIYADGADLRDIEKLNENPKISGFTTNPSLMKKAGIKKYSEFGKTVLGIVKEKPVSFEVLADEHDEMFRQAMILAEWGENVFVKIPVINTQEKSNINLMTSLLNRGVKINATAVFTYGQITDVCFGVKSNTPAIVSIFAGRIADTGRDPTPFIRHANERKSPNTKILWASTREAYNYVQAKYAGADIITMPSDVLNKFFRLTNQSLSVMSLDTVKMFYEDARETEF